MKAFFRQHYWAFALAMSLLIFLSSSWPHPPQPIIDIPFYDKWGHILVYLVLGICYLNVATLGFARIQNIRINIGWLATILYGLSDEFHQSFVPGRHSDWHDVIADAVGATIAWLGVKVYFHLYPSFE